MSYSINDLHSITDAQVIAHHDAAAVHTSVGTDYWMQELARRSSDRAAEESIRLTNASVDLAHRTYVLTIVSSITSILALVVAVIAIFK